MVSMGNVQILHIGNPDLLKEISTSTSFDLGRTSLEERTLKPWLGQGILMANGALWARQRKILAPEFYMDKVKVYK